MNGTEQVPGRAHRAVSLTILVEANDPKLLKLLAVYKTMQKRVLDSLHRQMKTRTRGHHLTRGSQPQPAWAQACEGVGTLLATRKTGKAVATCSNSASGASLFTGI